MARQSSLSPAAPASMDISHLRRDKESPFTTPSDVLHALNTALQSQQQDGNGHDRGQTAKTTAVAASPVGRFELQTRLPDGSSRLASERELQAADLESKLNQVVNHIAGMTLEEKLEWAEEQRRYGNQLYAQQHYQQAMDVYLTLLPVAYENLPLFARTMNNLAQAALALQWYRKATQFCSMALERIHQQRRVDVAASVNDLAVVDPVQMTKLYYRRAKAERLSGNYLNARRDLRQAASWLEPLTGSSDVTAAAVNDNRGNDNDDATDDNGNSQAPRDDAGSYLSLRHAIQMEDRLLRQATTEAKRNQDRTKRAMQQLWSAPSADTSKSGAPHMPDNFRSHARHEHDDDEEDDALQTSPRSLPGYFDWYVGMAGRIAERLLILLGDEDWVRDRHNKPKDY